MKPGPGFEKFIGNRKSHGGVSGPPAGGRDLLLELPPWPELERGERLWQDNM